MSTQKDWNDAYRPSRTVFADNGGAHIFQPGDYVIHNKGHVGSVIWRSALTAIIHWQDGSHQLVEQFDPCIWVQNSSSGHHG